MAKKAPAKPATKRKPRAKKPVVPVDGIELSEFSEGTLKQLREILDRKEKDAADLYEKIKLHTPVSWNTDILREVFFVALAAIIGIAAGIWIAGGISVGPDNKPVVNDSLSQSHAADRVSQIRILREYAGKTFADEPTAQKWLNDQRIEARKADWIPYTDELGAAADSGVDAVKALADKLEGK